MKNNNFPLSSQQLREARLQRGWSQRDLADQVGTTVVTIKRWERGIQTPSPHFRFKLAAVFAKEIEHLSYETMKVIPLTHVDTPSSLQKPPLEAGMGEEISTSRKEPQKHYVTEKDVTEERKFISDDENRHDSNGVRATHLTQKQSRRAFLKWGGIGLAITFAASGVLYWSTRASRSSVQFSLSSPIYTYYAPKESSIFDVKWSSQGDFLACVNENKVVQVIAVLSNGFRPSQTNMAVNCVTWSPDGTQLASPGLDEQIHIWDPLNRVDGLLFPYSSMTPECITWSPDGKSIAMCGTHGIVSTWDTTTGRHLRTYHGQTGIVWWIDWSSDGTRLATAGADGSVHIWNVTTGNIVYIYTGHTQSVQTVKWSPSGKWIVSASKDKTVHVWDAQTGKTTLVYTKHTRSVEAAEWSPNEQFIASGSADTTICIWNAVTGENTVSYHSHTSTVWALTWSPNGQYLASSSEDGTMQVHRTPLSRQEKVSLLNGNSLPSNE
jgi:WD40 repeat protein/DNA-binding XRE family transcriptional regulator